MNAPDPHHEPELAQHLDLLEAVAAAFDRVERIPQRALELAYAARTMSEFEAEVAELIFDSSKVAEPAMRNEQENPSRFLTFANDKIVLDLSLPADDEPMVGQIEPAAATELIVEREGTEPTPVPIDDAGRFTVPGTNQSFRLRIPGHLITPWISR